MLVDRLGTSTKKPLGAADKRLVSQWYNDGKLSQWPLKYVIISKCNFRPHLTDWFHECFLAHVRAWCREATGHFLDQCLQRSITTPGHNECFFSTSNDQWLAQWSSLLRGFSQWPEAEAEAEVQAALKKTPVKRCFELGLVYPDLEPPLLGMEGMSTTYSFKAETKGFGLPRQGIRSTVGNCHQRPRSLGRKIRHSGDLHTWPVLCREWSCHQGFSPAHDKTHWGRLSTALSWGCPVICNCVFTVDRQAPTPLSSTNATIPCFTPKSPSALSTTNSPTSLPTSFRYPYIHDKLMVCLTGDGREYGGRHSTFLALTALKNELLENNVLHQSPKECFPIALFCESDSRDNLEQNLTKPTNVISKFLQIYPSDDASFIFVRMKCLP